MQYIRGIKGKNPSNIFFVTVVEMTPAFKINNIIFNNIKENSLENYHQMQNMPIKIFIYLESLAYYRNKNWLQNGIL